MKKGPDEGGLIVARSVGPKLGGSIRLATPRDMTARVTANSR